MLEAVNGWGIDMLMTTICCTRWGGSSCLHAWSWCIGSTGCRWPPACNAPVTGGLWSWWCSHHTLCTRDRMIFACHHSWCSCTWMQLACECSEYSCLSQTLHPCLGGTWWSAVPAPMLVSIQHRGFCHQVLPAPLRRCLGSWPLLGSSPEWQCSPT